VLGLTAIVTYFLDIMDTSRDRISGEKTKAMEAGMQGYPF